MSNPTVLLIDYEPASIEQMKGPLLAAGYTVEVVFDGLAGLKAFNEMKPDLVLIEAMIPKKHGFEVCQEIKKTPAGKNTPVVIATSIYKGRKYRNQALKNYGCDEYLEKPVAGEDLMEVCRRYLKEVEVSIIDAAEQPEPADDPAVQPEQSCIANQGLNNLDAMDEKEISDKLDEILGAFGDAVDDARDPGMSAGPQPVQAPERITDQDMVMELLDEVGSAEPVDLTALNIEQATEPEPEPVGAVEPPVEPETESLPEPVVETEVEVAAQVDEVLPEAAYEGRTAEEYLSGVSITDAPAQDSPSGTRLLGLGIPVWIGIAAVVIAVAVGGFMFLGGSDDVVSAPPPQSRVATARTIPTPASPPILEQADPKAASVDSAETDSPGREDAVPAQLDPAPARKTVKTPVVAKPLPQPKKPAPVPVVTKAIVTPPVKKETTPPAKTEPAPIQPEPEPEPAAVQPAATETEPQLTLESRQVLAPQEQVIRATVPVSKPVVQERVRRAPAKPGDLVALDSVDTPPVKQVNVAAKYHPMARKLGQQGTVRLRLLIDETGTVADVRIVTEIPNSTLNQMAVKAARQWVYQPAVKDNAPVKVWKEVSLDFRL